MSTDTGPRKRYKDKKRRKGNDGESNITISSQLETPVMKLVADETIHIQNEANFGGNILSKFIFIAFLCVIGILLLFVLTEYNSFGDETEHQLLWLPKFFSLSPYFLNPSTEESVDKEEEVEPPVDMNYFDCIWQFLPFSESEIFVKVSDRVANSNENYENEKGDSDIYETNDLDKGATDDGDDTYDSHDNHYAEDDDANSDDEDNENEEDNRDENDNDDDELNREEERNEVKCLNDDMNNSRDSDEEDDETDNEDENSLKKNNEVENDDDEVDRYVFNLEKRTNDYKEDKDDRSVPNYDENDSTEDADSNDEESVDRMKDTDEYDSSDQRRGIGKNEEAIKALENQTDEGNNVPRSTNMITKLSVGVALVFVAYAVIIRKWNNYVNQVPESENMAPVDSSGMVQNQHKETFENIRNEIESKLQNSNNYIYDEGRYPDDNETFHEYLDSSTTSESEHSKKNAMRWVTSGPDILIHEVGDSESETSDSDNNNYDADQNQDVNRFAPKDYAKANITNPYDWQYKEDLDDADEDFDNGRVTIALEKYRKILRNHIHSVRAKYGIARSLDVKAELQKSNELLTRVIDAYVDTLLAPGVPNALFETVAERTVNRIRFKGDYESSIEIQNLLIDRFPGKVSYQNELVVTLLMLNRISEAKEKLEKMLLKWPDDGLATVHYGFVLKLGGNLTESVHYLDKGIKTNVNGTQDGRFYFHLGDALQRLKRDEEARKVYKKGVEKGLFYSEYQRSLYNIKRLTGRPWWTQEQTTYQPFFRILEQNWKHIRDEGVFLLKEKQRLFMEESEQLREMGDWRQFELFSRGIKRAQCNKAPITCRLINDFQPAAGCRRGQAKFSLMEPGTHVWPHCGPTNCRLRAHLGLIVPANVSIRVASETRNWEEGHVMIFDDSFEHEVWHKGSSSRLILIVDVWHPELTARERQTLAAI